MGMQRTLAMLCVAVSVAACGGGGGGGSGNSNQGSPAPSTPTPPATVSVKLTTAPIQQSIDYGDDFSTAVDGTWTGSNLGTGSVYLQVTDSGNSFVVPAIKAAPADNTLHFDLNAITNVQAGERTGTLTVRACKDTACTQPYDNASASVSYRLQVAAVGEWETIQRDATHNGYVPIRLDPARFAKIWEWNFAPDPAASDASITRAATGPGVAYVVASNLDSAGNEYDTTIRALDETSGAEKWTYKLTGPATMHAMAPAASGGLVYVPTTNSDTLLTAIDATTGALRFRYAQDTLELAPILAPAFRSGAAYFFAGTSGNEIHAIDGLSGNRHWTRSRVGLAASSPAVDNNQVYYYGAGALHIHDRVTGNLIGSIADPASAGGNPPGATAVAIGSHGNVIANSYNPTTNVHKLSSFNVANRQWEWSSQYSYRPLFAVADGVVYAVRRGTTGVDAIDEATGALLWTWTPPAADSQHFAFNNIIATKNLLFVATESTTGTDYLYAIDRSTRREVWKFPETGYPVISANRILYLVAGESTKAPRRVVAIKLR